MSRSALRPIQALLPALALIDTAGFTRRLISGPVEPGLLQGYLDQLGEAAEWSVLPGSSVVARLV
ncbi:hypothetical protein KJ682_13885 [bacterium]|nr:hypothetical protein [bacterium]